MWTISNKSYVTLSFRLGMVGRREIIRTSTKEECAGRGRVEAFPVSYYYQGPHGNNFVVGL